MNTLVDLLMFRAENDSGRGITYLPRGEGEEQTLTYVQLDRQARNAAQQLAQISRPGDRVALMFGEGTEMIVAFFAVLYAGLVAVPLVPPTPNQPLNEILSLLDDAQASVILTASQMKPLLAHSGGRRIIELDELNGTQADGWTPVSSPPEALATLLYTSGSTSEPRGVMFSHRHMVTRLKAPQVADRLLVSWMPLFHVFGLFNGLLQPIYRNADVVMLPTSAVVERPARWLQAISRYKAFSSSAPNFAFQACLDAVSEEETVGLDLSSWGQAWVAAEPIRSDTLRQFTQRFAPLGFNPSALTTSYSMSEGKATGSRPRAQPLPFCLSVERSALAENRVVITTDEEGQTLVSCGSALPGQRVVVVDPETCEVLGDDKVGEIWNSGPLIADGYWRQPEQTTQVFQARLADGDGPFLRTGDLGFLHDGQLYVTGRLKDMLILHGKNLYAIDLEHTAEQAHPALLTAASAAFSVPVGQTERLVLIHEVKSEYTQVDVDEVAAAVRRQIARVYQLPVHAVVLVEAGELPRTQTGKLRRFRAREQYLSALADQASSHDTGGS